MARFSAGCGSSVQLDRLAGWLISFRAPLFLAGMIAAAAALPLAWHGQSDLSVQSLFTADDPRLVLYNRTAREFGGEATVLAVYRDPAALSQAGMQRLVSLRRKLADAPYVNSAICLADLPQPREPTLWSGLGRAVANAVSLHWREGPPGILRALHQRRPKTLLEWFRTPTVDVATLRREIVAAELYRDAFISKDGQVVAVLLQLDRMAMASGAIEETIGRLREIVRTAPPEPGYLVGAPVMINDVYTYLTEDAARLQWTSTAMMLTVIGLLFRNLRWMLLPLLVVAASMVWTRAFMNALGIRQSLIASMTESLATVIGVAAVVHVAVFLAEDACGDVDDESALRRTLARTLGSFFWTCVITAVGFAALFVARIKPVREYAAVMTAAALFVGIATVLFVPGGALFGRRWVASAPRAAWADASIGAGLGWIIRFVGRHAFAVMIALVGGMAIASVGFRWLRLETEFTKNFRADAPVLASYNFVESNLGGAGVLEVVFSADAATPRLLETMREASREIARLPYVAKVEGLHDVVDFAAELLGVASKTRSPWRDWLRSEFVDRGMIAALERFPDGDAKRIVDAFWNRSAKRMRLLVRVQERQDVGSKTVLLANLKEISERHFGPTAETTGIFVMLVFLVDTLIQDQWTAVGASAFGCVITASLAFGSLRLGLVAFAPKLVLVAAVIGAMGWLGLRVNVATAMIGSVSMGLVVAFSVPYLDRFRQERQAGAPFYAALSRTHWSAGKAMVFANLALMLGFLILTTSRFIPAVHFGFLVGIAILGGVIGNLFLLPVLLRLVYWQPPPKDHPGEPGA